MKLSTSAGRLTTAKVIRGLPAIILGFQLNLLDLVSTGLLLFPTGSQSGFSHLQSASLSIYLVSIVTSQLAMTFGGSTIRGAFGSMLVEVLPLLRDIAVVIQTSLGSDSDALVPTVLVAYSLCSFLMGLAFLGLGVFRASHVIGYFPPTVLDGIIGSSRPG
jgi:sulfate permease, SulP family